MVHNREVALANSAIRCLVCPLIFVAGHWALLLIPGAVLAAVPRLWSTAHKEAVAVRHLQPKDTGEAFRLGWQASYYASFCANATAPGLQPVGCQDALRLAAEAVGAPGPLTALQLEHAAKLMEEAAEQRRLVDRVVGVLNFVNIIWAVSIAGLVFTVGPCLAYLTGPFLKRVACMLATEVILPAAKLLRDWGVTEAGAYALAFAVSAQSRRYPAGQARAAAMVGLTGGLLFLPCWAYSSHLHRSDAPVQLTRYFVVSSALLMLVALPLALLHDSQLIGFLAVLAAYASLGFIFQAFGFGFCIGFDSRDSLHRCLAASAVLILVFTACRACGLDPVHLRPFAPAAMTLGNVMYFLASLILSSGWRTEKERFWHAQAIMLTKLLAAIFVGSVFAIPSMTNTALTFMVLWMMEKQLEINWGGWIVVVLFANFLGLYFIAHHLQTHPERITSMFDPSGLYVAR